MFWQLAKTREIAKFAKEEAKFWQVKKMGTFVESLGTNGIQKKSPENVLAKLRPLHAV